MISRKLNWVASINDENFEEIESLRSKLVDFYTKGSKYYDTIDFTKNYWNNELAYKTIRLYAESCGNICEIGCGSANILSACPTLSTRYSGCDFSSELIISNQKRFPFATFKAITDSNKIPFENARFDLVFSIFVLEHVTKPHIFLEECYRLLKPGGRLVILCPDYLMKGRMSSQRSGLSSGTTKDKLRKFRIFDALVTLYDNRVKIPLYCWYKRITYQKPVFLINIEPIVFSDDFTPDVDAVYVTYRKEIIDFFEGRLVHIANNEELEKYERRKKWLFLQFIKS